MLDDAADNPAALIARIAEDADRDAFQALFLMFAPRVKSYLLGLGAAPAVAEDLAQETLLTVWRKAAAFDPARAGAATWIFTIARNLRIDAARRDRSALAYSLTLPEPPEPVETPDDLALAADGGRKVREAIQGLSGEQKEAVQLAFFQDKPHAEIAAQLGVPLGTVKSRVRLALARLRARLEALS